MEKIKQIPAMHPISERTSGVSFGSVDSAKAGSFYMKKPISEVAQRVLLQIQNRSALRELLRRAYLDGKYEATIGNREDDSEFYLEKFNEQINQLMP